MFSSALTNIKLNISKPKSKTFKSKAPAPPSYIDLFLWPQQKKKKKKKHVSKVDLESRFSRPIHKPV